MVYDTSREAMLYYDGALHELWSYDGTDWTLERPSCAPSTRRDFGLAFDSARNVLVLFGGATGGVPTGDTWEWHGREWLEIDPPVAPPAMDGMAMTFDVERGVVLLFGGRMADGSEHGGTWTYNGTSWSEVTPSESPSPRRGHRMVYTTTYDRTVLLFGGIAGELLLSDTWEWDGSSWTERVTPTSPSGRYGFGLAYVEHDRFGFYDGAVLVGGLPSTFATGHWEISVYDWQEQGHPFTPAPRAYPSMAYDSARQIVVLFGGETDLAGGVNDTWEFDVAF